jgi:hypothetical protein
MLGLTLSRATPRLYPISDLAVLTGGNSTWERKRGSQPAAVTSVTSSASVLDVDLTVPAISFAELPASGSAPPAYNVTNSLPSFSTTLGPASLTTGLLTDTASGDTGTGLGSATATLNNLAISLDSIFNLTSTLISSTSSVDGTPSAT